jgi:hypothetical protein
MGLTGLGLVLALTAAAVLCQADEPKKDVDNKDLSAEDRDRALEEIALAYRPADAGRKAGSPEALPGAAKILSRLNGKDIGLIRFKGVKPIQVKRGDKPRPGEPVKEEGGKPTHFEAEIQKLKADARKPNHPRGEHLAALIDKVPDTRPAGERGTLNGPKRMGRSSSASATPTVKCNGDSPSGVASRLASWSGTGRASARSHRGSPGRGRFR